jgi:hypothetical protein
MLFHLHEGDEGGDKRSRCSPFDDLCECENLFRHDIGASPTRPSVSLDYPCDIAGTANEQDEPVPKCEHLLKCRDTSSRPEGLA